MINDNIIIGDFISELFYIDNEIKKFDFKLDEESLIFIHSTITQNLPLYKDFNECFVDANNPYLDEIIEYMCTMHPTTKVGYNIHKHSKTTCELNGYSDVFYGGNYPVIVFINSTLSRGQFRKMLKRMNWNYVRCDI